MPSLSSALRAVERAGILLVYPITNRSEPRSLWSERYPRKRMNWSWTEDSDAEVAELWRLREALARSGRVVYGKWFRGRATFFSHEVFTAMLARLRDPTSRADPDVGLPRADREVLERLEENSPVSTKELRAGAMETGLFARRGDVDRAMRELWARLLIVGTGEIDDGAFPSLLVGATSLIHEPLWEASREPDAARDAALTRALGGAPLFAKAFEKVLARVEAARATATPASRSPEGP